MSGTKIAKHKAKLLKRAGIVKYDLRRNLTPAQKSVITRQWNRYGELITNTERYARRHVSNKRIKELKKHGYKTHGNTAWIPMNGYENVHIKHGKIVYRGADKGRDVLLDTGANILRRLTKLTRKQLPPGQRVTVKIGENDRFSIVFASYKELENYLRAWHPENPKHENERENLINQMSIVYFYGEDSALVKAKRKQLKKRSKRELMKGRR